MTTNLNQLGSDDVNTGTAPYFDAKRSTDTWLHDLNSEGSLRAEAIYELNALARHGVLFALSRTTMLAPTLGPTQVEQMVEQCTQQSLLAILDGLPTFRSQGKFTTWAYKFAVKSALVAARREGWRLK